MSVKIVFNGKQYDGVEAMPPEVRRAYEAALESLGKAGGETLASLLKQGTGTSIKATFREIVVDGKKYGSLDEMPPDIRQTYEEAMANLAPGELAGSRPAAPPPLLEDDQARGGRLWRIAIWMVVAALALVWLLRRR